MSYFPITWNRYIRWFLNVNSCYFFETYGVFLYYLSAYVSVTYFLRMLCYRCMYFKKKIIIIGQFLRHSKYKTFFFSFNVFLKLKSGSLFLLYYSNRQKVFVLIHTEERILHSLSISPYYINARALNIYTFKPYRSQKFINFSFSLTNPIQ